MNDIAVTNKEFLAALRAPSNATGYIPFDSVQWVCSSTDAKSWAGWEYDGSENIEFLNENTYFNISLLRAVHGVSRKKEYFEALMCIVLDDVGTKVQAPALQPSWILETSPGNQQWGYILAEPVVDLGEAEAIIRATIKAGYSDTGAGSPVRYMRLPVGSNSKPEHTQKNNGSPVPHRVLHWQPELWFPVDELVLGLNLQMLPSGNAISSSMSPVPLHPPVRMSDKELIQALMENRNYHDSVLQLTARYAGRGMQKEAIIETIQGFLSANGDTTERCKERFNDVPRAVAGAIKKFKKEARKNDNDNSSHLFPDIEAWPEAFSSTALLDELAEIFRRFVILPPHADIVLALWVVFSWCIDHVNIAPLLVVSSPEKQCGKTTLLSLLGKLVLRPLPSANITAPALFRSIEKWQPTLIIDEADTFINSSEELRGVLNSAHSRDGYTLRCTGDSHEPMPYKTWGAKAIALIGKLTDTLHDRSIIIGLRRKLPHEKTDRLRYANSCLFDELRRKLKRVAEDNAEQIKKARPVLPDTLSDRAADNWEPLLAIAQLAGAEWEHKAHNAALALSGRTESALSTGTELLADIKTVFESLHGDKITTSALISALCADKEKCWATYHQGKEITPHQLSKILRDYRIQRVYPTNSMIQ